MDDVVNGSNADYAKRELFRKRLKASMQRGDKYVKSLSGVTIGFHPDFDEFVARTAHSIRHHVTYRSDQGRIARGLVRASGDLERIHQYFNEQATPPGAPLRLKVLFWRRKSVQAGNRWVMNIRFEPQDTIDVPESDLTPDPNEIARIHKHRIDSFIDRAVILGQDISGHPGNRIRKILDMIDDMPAFKVQKLWFYSVNNVMVFVDFRTTPSERKRMTAPTGGHLPFKGYAPGHGLWRIYPFERIAKTYSEKTWTDRKIKIVLKDIDNGLYLSRYKLTDAQARAGLGGGSSFPETVKRFFKHVRGLENDRGHLYGIF